MAVIRRLRVAVAAVLTVAGEPSARATSAPTPPATTCRAHAPEAAVRAGIAVDVILRVMQAESAGTPGVVSLKGAMGCMQIMPATWAYLSPRYRLGADPYDARMNMIGGAMYLAELARRFGWPGAYAAYSAGPTRYIRYAASGVPLPAETVAYAARLGGAAAPAIATVPHIRWQEARLFIDRANETTAPNELNTLGLAAAPVSASPSPASPAASRNERIVATLFPLAESAAPASQ